MPQDVERFEYARELMESLGISTSELSDHLNIHTARISDFRNGRIQSAALQSKISDAIYRISKVWHRLTFPCPLSELDAAEQKLASLDRLRNLAHTSKLELELTRRASANQT